MSLIRRSTVRLPAPIRLVYTYEDLAAYEENEARTLQDQDYAAATSAMESIDGTITYSVFREAE